MTDIKEIIRVLGFIQEYFDNHADEQEPDCRKELFRDWSEITLDAIVLLKAQEPIQIIKVGYNDHGRCLKCDRYVSKYSNFCWYCGQAVKWE